MEEATRLALIVIQAYGEKQDFYGKLQAPVEMSKKYLENPTPEKAENLIEALTKEPIKWEKWVSELMPRDPDIWREYAREWTQLIHLLKGGE